MLFRKSDTLTGQLFRRVISLSVIAVFNLLAVALVGTLAALLIAQRDLDRAGNDAAHNYDLFMARIESELQAVSDSLQADTRSHAFSAAFNRYPSILELALVDSQGTVIEEQSRTGTKKMGRVLSDQPWLEKTQAGDLYIGPFDLKSYGVPSLDLAIEVDSGTGQLGGTLIAKLNVTTLWNQVVDLRVGESGYAYIVDDTGQILAASNRELVTAGTNIKDAVGHSPQDIADNSVLGLFSIYTGINDRMVLASGQKLSLTPWYAIVEQPHLEALGGFVLVIVFLIITLIASIVLVYSIGRFVRRNIVLPLHNLASGLRVFQSGDLSYEIEPTGGQEFRELTTTINDIAHELDRAGTTLAEVNQTLEQRVAERSRDLATVAQVTTQTATLLEVPQLLQAVVDLTKMNFNLYHAHVYLLDDSGKSLELAAGSGEIGRVLVEQGHRISLEAARSLVASAARTQSVVTADDVNEAPDFLPNPLLPRTSSELAVALVARGQLLGVLDVQSETVGHFGQELQAVMRILAQQIAAALSNARLYSESERVSRQEVALSAITQQMQSAASIEDVLQTAARELGKALRVPSTTIALQLLGERPPQPEDGLPYGTDVQVTPG